MRRGDDVYGGWRWHTLRICATCVAVLALADLSVRVYAGVTTAVIPPMLVFASILLRGRALIVVLALSLADLLLLLGIAPMSTSRVVIVIIGVIAVAAAGLGVWLRRYSVAPDRAGPELGGEIMVTGRPQHSPSGERTDVALALRLANLSRREQDVARLVLDGLPTREIANRLFISERTVETHLANIFDKTGVHSRRELVDSLLNRKPPSRKPPTTGDASPNRSTRRR